MKLVLTCEHAGNRVPEEYKKLFDQNPFVLETHRGYDPGAFDLFNHLKKLSAYSRYTTVSRLLIEANRSLHHPQLFSLYSQNLPSEEKQEIIGKYYRPYRREVEQSISALISAGEEVLHLSIHSFTPNLDGKIRDADIGLLYDPSRRKEKNWVKTIKKELTKRDSTLKIRANYPYRGTSDGFTTSLRKTFPVNYIGIEIEVNQKFVENNIMDISLKTHFYASLKTVLEDWYDRSIP